MYITTEVEVDIDIDDVLYELSTREKKQLCQELIDDGYGPEGEDQMLAETYAEEELIRLMNDVWQTRVHLTAQHVDHLRSELQRLNVL